MLKAFIVLGLAMVGVLTIAGFFAPVVPALDFVNHARPAILTASILLMALATGAGRCLRVAATITLAFNAVLFLAPFGLAAARGGPAPNAGEHEIKLITFNILRANPSAAQIADFILAQDADLVLLQELSHRNLDPLATRLGARYPHAHICAAHRSCSQALFSKRPWIEAGHVTRRSGYPEMVWARFRDGRGGTFRVHGVHAAYPFKPADQTRHVERLIAFRASVEEPLILAGDLNLTPWSYKLQRLQWTTGLRRHATLLASWPTLRTAPWLPPVFLIDHVLSTPEFETISIEIGPPLGSDHRPVIARLRFRSKSTRTPVVTTPPPVDLSQGPPLKPLGGCQSTPVASFPDN